MCLFACRGHSASLIKNHSEVKVTLNIIMPFFAQIRRCLISKGMGIGVYFVISYPTSRRRQKISLSVVAVIFQNFFQGVEKTRVISCVSL